MSVGASPTASAHSGTHRLNAKRPDRDLFRRQHVQGEIGLREGTLSGCCRAEVVGPPFALKLAFELRPQVAPALAPSPSHPHKLASTQPSQHSPRLASSSCHPGMSAEDDVAALLLALHDGPASASTSPTQAVKPPPPALTAGSRPSSSGSSSQAGPTPFKPAASPSPTPALAFPGAFVVPASSAPGPLPSQLPAATTSSIRRATSPTPNPSARYLSPSLGSGGPSSSTARGGSGSPYDAYYGSTAAAGPSTPAQTGTSLPPFQSLDLEGPQASSSQGFHAGGSGSYYGQSSYYPPPPPSHHYGPQPSYGTGPSSAGSYLSLPPRDPNIHPALQQQQKQQQHPTLQQPPRRPPNSPGQSSDIEPADEDDEQKPPTVSQPPPPPPLAIIPETAAGLAPAPAPAKKRKRASGVGKEGGGKGKGRGKAATAAAAAGIGETSAVAAAASGLHILDPDSGIIRCICESTVRGCRCCRPPPDERLD